MGAPRTAENRLDRRVKTANQRANPVFRHVGDRLIELSVPVRLIEGFTVLVLLQVQGDIHLGDGIDAADDLAVECALLREGGGCECARPELAFQLAVLLQ